MRIAMAAPLYLPDFRGGAIQVCRSLSAGLRGDGHFVSILAGRATADVPVGAIQREILEEFPLWRVNLGGALEAFSPDGYYNPLTRSAFDEFFAAMRPDVLHVHGLQGLGVGVLQAAVRARVSVVVSLHDWWWQCPCLFGLSPSDQVCSMPLHPEHCSGQASYDFQARREALQAVLPLVDRFLVPSEFLLRSLVEQGFPAERLLVSSNGTARPGLDALEKESLPGILRVGFFGGAGNREKGLADLGDAIGRLPLGRFQFLLYGVPRSELELNRSDVVHPPPFEPEDLDTVCAGMDVLVVPSRMRESFSLVTREAMVRGVPVVATTCGGPEEVIVDGQNGFRVPVGDPASLAEVLQRLADDRPLEAALALGARRTAEEFPSLEQQREQTSAVYREVFSTNTHRRYPARRPRIGGKRVLFLSGCDGAPLRYRVHHVAESLAMIGVTSRVFHYAAPEVEEEIRHADIVILFRTPFDLAVHRILRTARTHQLPVAFSSDDLIFHPDWLQDAPALLHEDDSLVRGFRESARACARTASLCDVILGSSTELIAAAEDLGMPSFLLRNSTGSLLERISRSCGLPPEGSLQMGYFSGTDTHDRDLAAIAPALGGAMDRVPELGLALVGPVAIPEALQSLESRIEKIPMMGWSDLPAAISRMRLNLGPLEAARRFNAAKSDVKFLEAALVGVPSVLSPTPEFLRGTRGGQLARLADTLPAWEEAIVDLARNQQRSRCLGDSARSAVAQSRGPAGVAEAWGEALVEILTAIPRSSQPLPAVAPGQQPGFAIVDLEPAGMVTDVASLAADSGEALSDAHPLSQQIHFRGHSPRRIDIRFGTYGRVNAHQIHVEVTDVAGQICGSRSLSAAALVDRGFVGIPLVADVSGDSVRVEIRSEGAGPGNEVLIWRSPDPDGCLRIGERPPVEESISFRAFSELDS